APLPAPPVLLPEPPIPPAPPPQLPQLPQSPALQLPSLACTFSLSPLEVQAERVSGNDTSVTETDSTESQTRLVSSWNDNNCQPSFNQAIDLEIPPLPTPLSVEESLPESANLNVISPEEED
ncbi:MAG: hypothetical protein F6K47_35090, partial [Symploca sp. SIO2E6]|nr:hypothetical protein [Symploca sp. SIO2E6]